MDHSPTVVFVARPRQFFKKLYCIVHVQYEQEERNSFAREIGPSAPLGIAGALESAARACSASLGRSKLTARARFASLGRSRSVAPDRFLQPAWLHLGVSTWLLETVSASLGRSNGALHLVSALLGRSNWPLEPTLGSPGAFELAARPRWEPLGRSH